MEENKNTFGRFSEKLNEPVSLNDSDWNSINKKINKTFFFKWVPTSFNIYYLSGLLLSTTVLACYIYSETTNDTNILTKEISYSNTNSDTIKSTTHNYTKLTNNSTKRHNKQKKNNVDSDNIPIVNKTSLQKPIPFSSSKTDNSDKIITDHKNPTVSNINNSSPADFSSTNNQKAKDTNKTNLSEEKAEPASNTVPSPNYNNPEPRIKPDLNTTEENANSSPANIGTTYTVAEPFLEFNTISNSTKNNSSTTEGKPSIPSIADKNNINDSVIDYVQPINDQTIDSFNISKPDTSKGITDTALHKPVIIHRRDTIFNYDSTKVPRYRKKKFGLK